MIYINLDKSIINQEVESFAENTTLLDLYERGILNKNDSAYKSLKEFNKHFPEYPMYIYNYYSYQELFSMMLITKDEQFIKQKGIMEEIYEQTKTFLFDKKFIASLTFYCKFINKLGDLMANEENIMDMYQEDLIAFVNLVRIINIPEYLKLFNDRKDLFALEMTKNFNESIKTICDFEYSQQNLKSKEELITLIKDCLNNKVKFNTLNYYSQGKPLFKAFNQYKENGDLRDQKLEHYFTTNEKYKDHLYSVYLRKIDETNFSVREFLLANEDNNESKMAYVSQRCIDGLRDLIKVLPNNELLVNKFIAFNKESQKKEITEGFLNSANKFLDDKQIQWLIKDLTDELETEIEKVKMLDVYWSIGKPIVD